VLAHRLVARMGTHAETRSGQAVIARVLGSVAVPGARPSSSRKKPG